MQELGCIDRRAGSTVIGALGVHPTVPGSIAARRRSSRAPLGPSKHLVLCARARRCLHIYGRVWSDARADQCQAVERWLIASCNRLVGECRSSHRVARVSFCRILFAKWKVSGDVAARCVIGARASACESQRRRRRNARASWRRSNIRQRCDAPVGRRKLNVFLRPLPLVVMIASALLASWGISATSRDSALRKCRNAGRPTVATIVEATKKQFARRLPRPLVVFFARRAAAEVVARSSPSSSRDCRRGRRFVGR